MVMRIGSIHVWYQAIYQYDISDKIWTRIYGHSISCDGTLYKNSLMVLNGMWDSTNPKIDVQSEYWGGELGVDIEIDEKLNQQQQTEFKLDGENWRTETFAWIKWVKYPVVQFQIPFLVL